MAGSSGNPVGGVKVGTGYVEVRPRLSASAFSEMRTQISRELRTLGASLGESIGASLTSALASHTRTATREIRERFGQAGTQSGEAFSTAFTRSMERVENRADRLGNRLNAVATRAGRQFSQTYGREVGGAVDGVARVAERAHQRMQRSAETAATRSASAWSRSYGRTGAAATTAGRVVQTAHTTISRSASVQAAATGAAWRNAHAGTVNPAIRSAGTTAIQTNGAVLASVRATTAATRTAVAVQARGAASDTEAAGVRMQRSMASTFGYLGNAATTELHRIANTAVTTGQILTQSLTVPVLHAAGAAVQMGATMGDSLVSLQRRMTAMGIATQDSGRAIKELNDFAARTPFTFSDMAQALPKFLDAGHSLDQAKKIIVQFSDYSASVGVTSSVQYARALKGLTDVMTMGVVKTQDLNQMAQNGIPVWQALAEHMHTTVGKLRSDIASGEQIGSDTLLDALQSRFDRAAGAGEKASSTITGSLDNMKEKMRQTFSDMFVQMDKNDGSFHYTKLGLSLQRIIGYMDGVSAHALPLFKSGLERAVPVVEWAAKTADHLVARLASAPPWVKEVASSVLVAGPALMGFGGALKFAALGLGLFTSAPVAIAATVAAFAIGTVILWRNSKKFRDTTKETWDDVSSTSKRAWEVYIRPVFQALSRYWREDLGPALSEAGSKAAALWDPLADRAQEAWRNVLKPTLEALEKYTRERLIPAFQDVAHWVGPAIQFVADVVTTAVADFILPSFRLLLAEARPIIKLMAWLFTDVIGPVVSWFWSDIVKPSFEFIAGAISFAWSIIRPILVFFGDLMGWLASAIDDPTQKIIRPAVAAISEAFSAAGSGISWVWSNLIQPTLSFIVDAASKTGAAFLDTRDTLAGVWRDISDAISEAWKNSIAVTFDLLKSVEERNGLGAIALVRFDSGMERGPLDGPGCWPLGNSFPSLEAEGFTALCVLGELTDGTVLSQAPPIL